MLPSLANDCLHFRTKLAVTRSVPRVEYPGVSMSVVRRSESVRSLKQDELGSHYQR